MSDLKNLIENSNVENLPALVNDKRLNSVDQLSKLAFTDIYMSEGGGAFFRGLETSLNHKTPPLVGIPSGVREDVQRLQQQIFYKGREKNEFFTDYDGMRFRVTKMPAMTGTWYTLRRTMWPIPRFAGLNGIHPMATRALGALGNPQKGGKGLILFCGETGSGKTTTGFSLLQEYLISYGDIASTIEDPVELLMEGAYGANAHGYCFQHEVVNRDFESAMRRALRETPRYIFFGEIRGRDEAREALLASINGHVVLSTIHSGSVIQAIDRIVSLASNGGNENIARTDLSTGISAVIHQDLILNPNGPGKKLNMDYLFFGKESVRARNLIKSGQTNQLVTDMERQKSLMAQNEFPI